MCGWVFTLPPHKPSKPLVALGLSAASFAEQLRLIFGGFDLQEVSFITALEETSTSFGIFD